MDLQSRTINLTAAANYLSPVVSAAMHPALESIHCEGYPGRRYHDRQALDGARRHAETVVDGLSDHNLLRASTQIE